MEEETKKPLLERVNDLEQVMQDPAIAKRMKKLKCPKGAKVSKGKAKKGWIGVAVIDPNTKSIKGEKQKVEGSTFKTKDGFYHATDGREVVMWDGKFPVMFQIKNKINPVNFNTDKDETYGQPYVMARMLKDAIVMKKKGGGGMLLWVLIIGAVGYGAAKLMGWV